MATTIVMCKVQFVYACYTRLTAAHQLVHSAICSSITYNSTVDKRTHARLSISHRYTGHSHTRNTDRLPPAYECGGRRIDNVGARVKFNTAARTFNVAAGGRQAPRVRGELPFSRCEPPSQ
jgi:hypothetical protein